MRNGTTLYGIVSRLSDMPIAGTNCADRMSYTRIQSEMSAVAVSVVLGASDTSMLSSTWAAAPASSTGVSSADGSGLANGTRYLQWGCIYLQGGMVSPHPGQSFRLEPVAGVGNTDTYRLVRMNGSTKTCVSLDGNSAGGGYGDGALLILWDCIGSNHPMQTWRLEYQTNSVNGYFNIIIGRQW